MKVPSCDDLKSMVRSSGRAAAAPPPRAPIAAHHGTSHNLLPGLFLLTLCFSLVLLKCFGVSVIPLCFLHVSYTHSCVYVVLPVLLRLQDVDSLGATVRHRNHCGGRGIATGAGCRQTATWRHLSICHVPRWGGGRGEG